MGGYFEPRQDELLYEWLRDSNGSPTTTIWNNNIDETAQTDKFWKAIDKKSKQGDNAIEMDESILGSNDTEC